MTTNATSATTPMARLTPSFRTYVADHTAADCKNGGWKAFGDFRNQGDCVKSFR